MQAVRMRRAAAGAIAAALAAGACTRSAPQRPTAGELAAVDRALVNFSRAVAAGDTAVLRTLTTADFVLLEEGREYDRSAFFASIQPVLALGTMTRTPIELRTRMRGDVAWSRYRVTGEYKTTDMTMILTLLESAVLERDAGGWRIAQMSTLASLQPGSHP